MKSFTIKCATFGDTKMGDTKSLIVNRIEQTEMTN